MKTKNATKYKCNVTFIFFDCQTMKVNVQTQIPVTPTSRPPTLASRPSAQPRPVGCAPSNALSSQYYQGSAQSVLVAFICYNL